MYGNRSQAAYAAAKTQGPCRQPSIGGMDEDTPEETRRLNEEMALAAMEFLDAVMAMRPSFAVVFTVWASRTAAEGWGWRPTWRRTRSRS